MGFVPIILQLCDSGYNYSTSTYDNIENQLFTGLVLLDLAKAFDTLDHDILLQKLHHYGIRGIANNFFRSFLINRTQLASIANENSTPKFNGIGVPQGATLGPLLFLIYINNLPNCINSTPRLFADDTCLMINATTLKHLEKNLESEINQVCDWMIANKLTLNTSKSNLLIINPKRNAFQCELSINSKAGTIRSLAQAKYLGVILDDNLNFRQQLKSLETKIARVVGILYKLKYLLPENAMLNLYYALVHSNHIYGILVWGNTFPSYLSKLSKLQNKAIRIVTGKNWNDSANPLYQKLNILPLVSLLNFEISKFVCQHDKSKLPTSFLNYFTLTKNVHSRRTRASCNNQLTISLFKTQKTQRYIEYTVAKIWNSIPIWIKKYSFQKFKKHYKKFLITNLGS